MPGIGSLAGSFTACTCYQGAAAISLMIVGTTRLCEGGHHLFRE